MEGDLLALGKTKLTNSLEQLKARNGSFHLCDSVSSLWNTAVTMAESLTYTGIGDYSIVADDIIVILQFFVAIFIFSGNIRNQFLCILQN